MQENVNVKGNLTDDVVEVLIRAALRKCAALIAERRKTDKVNFSRPAVAAFLGVERTYYNKMLKGAVPFPLPKFIKLLLLLQFNPFEGFLSDDDILNLSSSVDDDDDAGGRIV